VQQWGGNHPTVIRKGGGGMDSAMWAAFIWAHVTLTLLLPPLLLWLRSRLALLESALEHTWQEALASGAVQEDSEDLEPEAVSLGA
jgi:hypothetical protein